MSLAEFLLARIAEDEECARPGWRADQWHAANCEVNTYDAGICDCYVPARVLAECEAKRRIVARCTDRIDVTELRDAERRYISGAPDMDMLRLLALPYADHPDCREEWRP